jgi:hypothetical protein
MPQSIDIGDVSPWSVYRPRFRHADCCSILNHEGGFSLAMSYAFDAAVATLQPYAARQAVYPYPMLQFRRGKASALFLAVGDALEPMAKYPPLRRLSKRFACYAARKIAALTDASAPVISCHEKNVFFSCVQKTHERATAPLHAAPF